MPRPVSAMLRHVNINGSPTSDARLVITGDGRAALIGRIDGVIAALATSHAAEWSANGSTITVVDGDNVWVGQRDTRCGSCGGRFELRTADANHFLPPPAAETPSAPSHV